MQKCFVLELLQLMEVGVPGGAAEGEAHLATEALGVDEAGLLQLLEMVRDGGRGDALLGVEVTAEQIFGAGDLLKDGEAAGVGEGAGDCLEVLGGEGRGGRRRCGGRGGSRTGIGGERHVGLDGKTEGWVRGEVSHPAVEGD